MTADTGSGDEQRRDEPVPRPPRAARVRPYAITRGRTRTRTTLALETLVHAAPSIEIRSLSHEQRTVCELCPRPISVAEISARAALPLGVVRVLLDDMAGAGLVVLHAPPADRPERALMERVLRGLQRL